ncbi:cyclic nucleotide-binding domain-containing protein [Chlamydiales bacterium]|nr:cyclic nucleotide-binding domain-containing protein [Chlamydiales bacterium]
MHSLHEYSNRFLSDFTSDELDQLQDAGVINHYKSGDKIIKANTSKRSLYVLLEGSVSIEKIEELDSECLNLKIAEVSEGEAVGEVSFLNDEVTPIDVVANQNVTALKLNGQYFEENPDLNKLYQKIVKTLLKYEGERIRKLNTNYVNKLENKLQRVIERQNFGYLCLCLIVVFSLFFLAEYFLSLIGLPTTTHLGGVLRILIICIPVFVYMYKFNYPLKECGLRFDHLLEVFLESIGLSILLTSFVFLYYLYVYNFNINALRTEFNWEILDHFWLIVYPFHAFLQELIIRGVLQFSLAKFLPDERGFLSIIVTTLILTTAHINYDPLFLLVLIGGNITLGIIYFFRQNLIEMTIIHTIVGLVALGYGEAATRVYG